MKQHKFKNSIGPVNVEVVFHSPFYTVARATVQVSNGNGDNGHGHYAHAEGISVRCWKDPVDDLERGKEVAEGRALKALSLKLDGKMRREHIKRATDLLMNG